MTLLKIQCHEKIFTSFQPIEDFTFVAKLILDFLIEFKGRYMGSHRGRNMGEQKGEASYFCFVSNKEHCQKDSSELGEIREEIG